MIPWKNIFTSWRVIILIIFLVLALIIIQPHVFGNEGVTIRSVGINSSAAIAGMHSPPSKSTPLSKEKIIAINSQPIHGIHDYYAAISAIAPNRSVSIETNKASYSLRTAAGSSELGLKVYDAPTSNLRKSLDLEGGIRVLLKPQEQISDVDLETTVDILKERLNVYGLSDVTVRTASDLSGDKFILIEMAGVSEEEVKELLARQGKFDAKIGNETVFHGGKREVTYVCRSAECSGIRSCSRISEGYACNFFFAISLSPEAAQKHAQITGALAIETSPSGQKYLSKKLDLYLDDTLVDTLSIGAELKGRASTDIQISGSGSGLSQEGALASASEQMKRLQTILITGSLPVKFDTVKLDAISPTLGKEFLSNILFVGILAIIAVCAVVALRYRRLKVIIPLIAIIISEVVLVLGFAAFVGWNLDLAAIAGILIVIGTAVDHLVVITDETIRKEVMTIMDWKSRIKNAMFIIMGAYFTAIASMIPLIFAGAGLLKGFAFTTIVGISFGVLIARPAYAAIIEALLSEG